MEIGLIFVCGGWVNVNGHPPWMVGTNVHVNDTISLLWTCVPINKEQEWPHMSSTILRDDSISSFISQMLSAVIPAGPADSCTVSLLL